EVQYHAAYAIFSLIAALSALSLARRFSQRPLAATLLFLATPAFIINGNSVESDLPLLAFWLMTTALFIKAVDKKSVPLLIAAAVTMPFAALAAYQSVMLIPILGIYLWNKQRDWKIAWITLLTVPATLGAWQLFERFTSESLPAEVLAGYFKT